MSLALWHCRDSGQLCQCEAWSYLGTEAATLSHLHCVDLAISASAVPHALFGAGSCAYSVETLPNIRTLRSRSTITRLPQ